MEDDLFELMWRVVDAVRSVGLVWAARRKAR